MSYNMYGICSVCLLRSPIKLTPLFVKSGNRCESTGLGEMLEKILEKKIVRNSESMLAVCNTCVEKISVSFNGDDFETKRSILEFFMARFPSLSPAEEEEAKRRGKLEAEDELRIVKFEEPENLINILDNDCWAKIFTYLPVLDRLKMENVCQKWKEASKFSWSNVKKISPDDLKTIPLNKKEYFLEKILEKCSKYLTHLNISKEKNEASSAFFKFTDRYINISHLDIYMGYDGLIIPCEDVHKMITLMPKLTSLKLYLHDDLENYTNFCKDFCYEILHALPNNMEKIYILSGQIDHRFPLPEFAILPDDKFNDLRCLKLHCFRLTNDVIQSILLRKNTLVELGFFSCHLPSGVSSLISNLHNLERLKLEGNVNLEHNTIFSITRNCPALKYLEYRRNKCEPFGEIIPYRVYREIEYLKNLEVLKFGKIDKLDNENVISIISPKLKKLDLVNMNISEFDLKKITKFKCLEYLHLSDVKSTSVILENILNNCLELKKIDMKFQNISECTFEKFGNLKKLETLSFMNHKNLTDNALIEILRNCKNLVELTIGECKKITGVSLIKVGKLKHLKKLFLNSIVNVPNAMFNDLCELEELACLRCPSVNDEGIKRVLDNCNALEDLSLFETSITAQSLVHASKRQFVFKNLYLSVDESVKNDYFATNPDESPYIEFL